MGNAAIPVLFACSLSILLSLIEVSYKSQISGQTSQKIIPTLQMFYGIWFFLYTIILMICNSATTIFVCTIISSDNNNFKEFGWFWSPFIGVFAFEAVIKNINVSFSDIDLLSIHDWIRKGRDQAVAWAIRKHDKYEVFSIQKVSEKLKLLPETVLNSHILQYFSQVTVSELDKKARESNADAQLLKAFYLAKSKPDEANAISKGQKK